MKIMKLTITACLIAILFLIACNSGTENAESTLQDSMSNSNQPVGPDYSGIYKVNEENSCQLSISITKDGQNYKYRILGDKLDCWGNLIVENVDGDLYFTFDGQIAENKPKTVSAKFVDGSIIIQNYGNSMNEYNYFKQCEEKYLEFKK
jgi:hypothetical protein